MRFARKKLRANRPFRVAETANAPKFDSFFRFIDDFDRVSVGGVSFFLFASCFHIGMFLFFDHIGFLYDNFGYCTIFIDK